MKKLKWYAAAATRRAALSSWVSIEEKHDIFCCLYVLSVLRILRLVFTAVVSHFSCINLLRSPQSHFVLSHSASWSHLLEIVEVASEDKKFYRFFFFKPELSPLWGNLNFLISIFINIKANQKLNTWSKVRGLLWL